MAKSKVTLRSNFTAVKKASWHVVSEARDAAILDGENTANDKIEKNDVARGYDLPVDVQKEKLGHQSGKIVYDHFYGKWFEYGTTFLPAMPFMRPGHRKMRKTFLAVMGDDFEGFIKRKASVRR